MKVLKKILSFYLSFILVFVIGSFILLILFIIEMQTLENSSFQYDVINGYRVKGDFESAIIELKDNKLVENVLKIAWNDSYIVFETESTENNHQYWVIDALNRKNYGPFLNDINFKMFQKSLGIDDLMLEEVENYFPNVELIESSDYGLPLIYGYYLSHCAFDNFYISDYDQLVYFINGLAWDNQYIFLRNNYDNNNLYTIIDTKNGMRYGQYSNYEDFRGQLSRLGREDVNFLSPSYYLNDIPFNETGEKRLNIFESYVLSTEDNVIFTFKNKQPNTDEDFSYETKIPNRVERLAWNDRYIIAQQKYRRESVRNYWILDTIERKLYGPYDLKEFYEKIKLYHLEDLLKSICSYQYDITKRGDMK